MAPRIPADQPRMIDQRGRVAIPPKIMQELDIEAGSHVVVEVKGKQIVITPISWNTK